MDVVIYLVQPAGYVKDADGIPRKQKPVRRKVYAKKKNVTQTEFFSGGRNGLNPELMFTMFGADYQGEKILEWDGKNYAIYRVYHPDEDYIELYAERKGGTNTAAT